MRQISAQIQSRGGLAHPAFLIDDGNNFTHFAALSFPPVSPYGEAEADAGGNLEFISRYSAQKNYFPCLDKICAFFVKNATILYAR